MLMNYLTSLIFLTAIISAVLYLKSKLPVISGYIGESFIARKLRTLDPAEYKVFNDVLLPSDGNTRTTQIDHLVLSVYGIFCIETKSHSGWIYGSAGQEKWTQVFYRKKYRFYNPLRQNYAHIKAIEQVLAGRLRTPIVSLVAFPSADKLIISGTDAVRDGRGTMRKLKSYIRPIYDQHELELLVMTLQSANILDKEAHKEHVNEVRSLHHM